MRLGDAVETVFCSLAIWDLVDYVDHWRHGASKCLEERRAFLFCTDLTDQNASVFAAFPDGNGFLLEEWVVPRRTFIVSGREIVPVGRTEIARSSGDTSSWLVDEAAMADFVQAS